MTWPARGSRASSATTGGGRGNGLERPRDRAGLRGGRARTRHLPHSPWWRHPLGPPARRAALAATVRSPGRRRRAGGAGLLAGRRLFGGHRGREDRSDGPSLTHVASPRSPLSNINASLFARGAASA